MATGDRSVVLDDIRTLFGAGTAAGLSDRQLLGRFATGGQDQAELAFEVLVDRHGPMVLRVCRDALRDPHDADDAFQATFLVLARRSGSIRRPEALGAWLHGVAVRVATNLRAGAARRRRHERARASIAETSPDDPAELGAILHEEIALLPEKFREAVVLCYLQGLTHEQAAARLGRPVGTIHSRLASARDRLKSRLTKRGLAPPAILLPRVPNLLARSAVDHAIRSVGGSVPSAVVTLTRQVLRTFAMTRLKLIAVGIAATGLVVAVGRQVPGAPKDDGRHAVVAFQTSPKPSADDAPRSGPDPIVESASILRARLDYAISQRVIKERLFKSLGVSTSGYDEAVFDVTLIAAQIETRRDDLSDELELLEARLMIRKADLEASIAMADAAQEDVKGPPDNNGHEIARRDLAVNKAQIPLKQAEINETQVRIKQAKRRLAAIEPLADLARKSAVPSLAKAPAPPPPPEAR